MSFFNNLIIFSILITPYLTLIDSAIFYVTNNCSYTIWAAANPGGGRLLYPTQEWVFNTDPNFLETGRIWARTNCDGNNKCESGDCGGVLACNGSYGAPPVTSAEYTFNVSQNMDFFDISLVDGFNVPMEFSPATSTSGCTRGTGIIKCSFDINRLCPTELRDPGGCLHPCTVFRNDQFCCIGRNSTRANCSPTAYSKIFKDACPNVYTYAYDDDQTATFTCPTGTDYKVVFCP